MPDPSSNAEFSPSGAGQEIVGRMAGEYRLLKKLGEGGFGTVYEAEHPVLRRRAAVKVLHQVAGMDSDAVLRFISEAQAANQIRCRHIVDVFSFGKLPNGRHFYVMDLLDGEPLDRYLRREGHCEVSTTLQLLRPIAEALDAAHAAGVVHRDLKPQNVFLSWDQAGDTVPKLLDFGMAKLLVESAVQTVSGVPVGTPLYMSPEQARGEKVDGRSDVYGLGVLCHEMLTGRVPFMGESPLAVLVSHLTVAPPRVSEVLASLPPELDEPVLAMLHKEPSGRPATAGAAVTALLAAAERAGVAVPPGMPRLPRPRDLPIREHSPFSPQPASEVSGEQHASIGLGATHPAPSRRRGWVLIAALCGLGLLAAYLGQGVLQSPSGTLPSEPAAVTAASAPPRPAPAPPVVVEPVAAPEPPAPPSHVELVLHGAPPGARVQLGDDLLGDAAGPVRLPYGTSPLSVTVSAPGYEPLVLEVVPERDRESEVKLKRRAARPKPVGTVPSDLESPF